MSYRALDLKLSAVFLALALSAVCWTATATAKSAKLGFYSGRMFHELAVSQDLVAVKADAGVAAASTAGLSAATREALAQMRLQLVRRDQLVRAESVVGYPVWFDQQQQSLGVLTHEIVVRLEPGAQAAQVFAKGSGAQDYKGLGFGRDIYLVKYSSPVKALAAANTLVKRKGVLYAHPNFWLPKTFRRTSPREGSGEPFFRHQWHLENLGQLAGTPGADIRIREAWAVTEGQAGMLVAVLDGGFQIGHPDLEGAVFVNPRELPGNGVDDDGNGLVDDVQGWNFYANSADVSAGVAPDHGTAVAGVVAARVNGKGVSGVCPQCQVLPVVVAWTPAEDAAAFFYAESMGASIITNSWGYAMNTPTTDVVADALRELSRQGRRGKGLPILFAMNNINQDDCIGERPDISSLDAVIAISAASDLDQKVSFSAYGDCMEVLAPSYESGRPGIATIDLLGQRGYNNGRRPADFSDPDYTNDFGGTSAATPITAGVMALMLSVNAELTRDEALGLLTSTAEKIRATEAQYDARGFSRLYGYGRIQAARAVAAAQAFRKYSVKTTPGRRLK